MATTTAITEIASGLKYPEGPIAMPDGSFVLVEIARGTLTRVRSDGGVEVIADLGGGPNGAAIGPDGYCYVCNNGGSDYYEVDGQLLFCRRTIIELPRWPDRASQSRNR